MEFSTKIDRLVQIISVGTIIFLFVIFFIINSNETSAEAQYLTFALVIGIPIITYALAPRGFVINQDGIVIKRLLGPVRIGHNDIKKITQFDKFGHKFRSNFIGSKGLFGYYGYLYLHQKGVYRLFITTLKDVVLIETDKKKYLLSPYPMNTFLLTLSSFTPNITIERKEKFS